MSKLPSRRDLLVGLFRTALLFFSTRQLHHCFFRPTDVCAYELPGMMKPDPKRTGEKSAPLPEISISDMQNFLRNLCSLKKVTLIGKTSEQNDKFRMFVDNLPALASSGVNALVLDVHTRASFSSDAFQQLSNNCTQNSVALYTLDKENLDFIQRTVRQASGRTLVLMEDLGSDPFLFRVISALGRRTLTYVMAATSGNDGYNAWVAHPRPGYRPEILVFPALNSFDITWFGNDNGYTPETLTKKHGVEKNKQQAPCPATPPEGWLTKAARRFLGLGQPTMPFVH